MKSRVLRAAFLMTATAGLLATFAAPPAEAAMTASISSISQCNSSGSCSGSITGGTGIAHDTIQITAKESSALLDPSVSGASQRAPVVTLKWDKSPEPDLQEYRFLRTDPSGNTKQYPVSATNYSAQGCSFDGTVYTCYDTDFPSTGFGGTYHYALTAYRSSPSQADTCYYPNQQTPCIGASSSDVRQVSIVEPSPSPTPTTGSGGGTGGGGTGGGNTGTPGGGVGSVPSGVPSVAGTQAPQ